MKKLAFCAILLFLVGCYTPLNNSGMATTKPWLEIPLKRTDLNGKIYDICYQFNLRFPSEDVFERLANQTNCITSCCWVSQTPAVSINLNNNYEDELKNYGKAKKFSPEKLEFSVSFASWINTARVSVTPKSAISNGGIVKLTYKEETNPQRLLQLEKIADYLKIRKNADQAEFNASEENTVVEVKPIKRVTKKQKNAVTRVMTSQEKVKELVYNQVGTHIDSYFYEMNKTYTQKGAIFLLSDRILQVNNTDNSNIFHVVCSARAKTGIDTQHLNSSTFSCGTWLVNLLTNSVLPLDARAKNIFVAN